MSSAAMKALRQLLLPTIRRRLATGGQPSITGGTTMAQGHRADRCVQSYMTEIAADQERTQLLIRKTERAKQALHFALGSVYAAGCALIYYGPNFPRKRNP